MLTSDSALCGSRRAAALALSLLAGCSSATPNRDPSGQPFPQVTATGLDGREFDVPADFAGEPVILLVGYVMEAQFDCDRWLLGLLQAATPGRVYELPTIEGMVPGMFAGTIDGGMRRGIPEEDWGSVLTVYGDADRVVEFTGDENPRNARVLLLDGQGQVVWFHDRGYSAAKVMELDALVRDETGAGE